jgi:ubiquinone/menaquinone biosynthesis C-methylase UbiE
MSNDVIPSDIWSEWLLNRRFGGNPEQLQRFMDALYPVRDRVLANAGLKDGDTLLDVGCGDGLIGFGALRRFRNTRVTFSDISEALLNVCREIAMQAQIFDRCAFKRASADNLSSISDMSVDSVAVRSVLNYVEDKDDAFREFFRVLRPGGRLSVFEPINSFNYEQLANEFWGLDVTPVIATATRMKARIRQLQPPETDPMLNFDERALFRSAERAGFTDIHLDYSAHLTQWPNIEWSVLITSAPNPKLPTWDELMNNVLTPDEKAAFVAHVRPQVEQRSAHSKSAEAYLWAVKPQLLDAPPRGAS